MGDAIFRANASGNGRSADTMCANACRATCRVLTMETCVVVRESYSYRVSFLVSRLLLSSLFSHNVMFTSVYKKSESDMKADVTGDWNIILCSSSPFN